MDPKRREMNRAERAFQEQQYSVAQALADEMARDFPLSATVRVIRGEATLYEHQGLGDPKAEAAARAALRFYRDALALHQAGCALGERHHYYLHMGMAYAHLRLSEPAESKRLLEKAAQSWPTSAEPPYHLARAHCLEANTSACAAAFELTLKLARARSRPKFLRTHNTMEHWIVRSETQRELEPLRKDPRYARIVEEARNAVDQGS